MANEANNADGGCLLILAMVALVALFSIADALTAIRKSVTKIEQAVEQAAE